jgi:N-methylhydantoinase A
MLATDVIKDYVHTIMRPGDTAYHEIEALTAPLATQGQADLVQEGIPASEIVIERWLDMRYQGQSYELMVPLTLKFLDDFHAAHTHAYGYSEPGVPVEVVNVRVRAIGRLPRPSLLPVSLGQADPAAALLDHRPVVLASEVAEIPFYDGQVLQPGHQLHGPAVVIHPDTTIFVGPRDKLVMDEYKNLIIDVMRET